MYYIIMFYDNDWQTFTLKGQTENISSFGAFGIYYNNSTQPLFVIICGKTGIETHKEWACKFYL